MTNRGKWAVEERHSRRHHSFSEKKMRTLCELRVPGKGINLYKLLVKEEKEEHYFKENVVRLLQCSKKGSAERRKPRSLMTYFSSFFRGDGCADRNKEDDVQEWSGVNGISRVPMLEGNVTDGEEKHLKKGKYWMDLFVIHILWDEMMNCNPQKRIVPVKSRFGQEFPMTKSKLFFSLFF